MLNGKEFPATQPIVAEVGDGVLIHLANDGAQIHPMHLHGYHFQVVAEDGFVLDPGQRYMADTLMVAPGQRSDVPCAPTIRACGRTTAISFRTSKDRRACTGW